MYIGHSQITKMTKLHSKETYIKEKFVYSVLRLNKYTQYK